VNLTPVLMRNIRLQGTFVGSRAMADRMHATLAGWPMRPVIDRAFGFDDAVAAFAYLAEGRHMGKVVIERA
jgi:NADPH:quinone reductase-like Zn-dependent oxidoreductase